MGLQKRLRRPRQFIIAEIEASPVVIDDEEVVEFSDIGSVQLADGHRMLSSFGPQDVIQDRIVAFQSEFGDRKRAASDRAFRRFNTCTGGISGFDRTVGVPALTRCSTFALLRFLQKGLAFAGKASIAVA